MKLFIPLYLSMQPERQPMTEAEIIQCWDAHTIPVFDKTGINPVVFARAIERHHGIGSKP